MNTLRSDLLVNHFLAFQGVKLAARFVKIVQLTMLLPSGV